MIKNLSLHKVLGFMITVLIFAIGFAWFLELAMKMEPCSLCLLQRWGVYSSLVFLISSYLILNFNKLLFYIARIILLSMGMLSVLFSLLASYRQTYIQLQPAGMVPSCGADLNTLLSIVTPLQAISQVFQGSGECSEKALVVLGLSLAMWAAILFTIIFVGLIVALMKMIKKY